MKTQKAIVTFLDEQTKKTNNLISKNRDNIDTLREYRSALISAAVTGKIDVREEVELNDDDIHSFQ